MSGDDSILMLGAAAPWRFGSPAALLLLIAVPVVGLLLWLAFLRRHRALERFEGVTPQDSRPSGVRAGVKVMLSMIAVSSLMVALARPQADPIEETVTVRGRDIVFLVDVSKSMLSRDAVPSRLGRAKLWINDLVNTLKGDRVGLVAFAGVPVVKCPLTLDYGYFRMALDELSPASVPRGGTLIGDAIRKTVSEVLEPGPGRYKDIVLITDGEDQGSYADQAAQKAAEMGVRIIAIGIGSELEGALVPSEEGNSQKFIEHDGRKVHSRMDSSTLASIASAASAAAGENGGGGVFLNVGTGTMDLDRVYHDLIGSAERKETETKSNVTYRELFPYFLGLAAICLAVEPLVGGRSMVRRRAARGVRPASGNPIAAAVLLGALVLPLSARAQNPAPTTSPGASGAAATGAKAATESAKPGPAPSHGPTADAIYNSGREKFLAGQYAQAAEEFRQADLGATDPELSARARFNLGQALLKQAAAPPAQGEKPDDGSREIAQLDSAARAFRSVLDVKPGDAEAARNVEIARKMMKEKQEEQQKQEQQKKDQQKKDQQKKDGDQSSEKGESEKNDQDKADQKQDSKQDQNQSGKDSKQSKSQQHQENADKLKDLAQQQSQAADKSKEAQDQKDAAAKEEKKQEAGKAQEQVSKETQAEKEKKEKSKEEAAKDAMQKMEEARKEQQAASQSLEKGDPKEAEQHQRKAAELLDQAAEAEQRAADEAAKSEAEQKDKKDQAKEEKPKYNDTASQLLDKERKQREARQQVLRALKGKPQPVDKDW